MLPAKILDNFFWIKHQKNYACKTVFQCDLKNSLNTFFPSINDIPNLQGNNTK